MASERSECSAAKSNNIFNTGGSLPVSNSHYWNIYYLDNEHNLSLKRKQMLLVML